MPKKPVDLMGAPSKRGSITQTADIQKKRVSDISNVSKTVNEMKKDVDQKMQETKMEMGESDNIERVQSSMNKVLQKLSETIGALTTGVKNITIDTAAATKDAIAQYGKAVSEDISVNKQNVVAMALSRTTPLFGYFAAKFMETDVFKRAATKMREGFGNVVGGIVNLFRKGTKGVGEKLKGGEGRVPKMQAGGYIERGGVAELHPAEVVMPIEDVLERVDEQVSISKQFMQVARKSQLSALGRMQTFVADSQKKARVGVVKGLLRAWSEVATQYMEPVDKRQLRALLAIQDALGAQIGTMRQVWQKMLIEHPFFRNLIFTFRALTGLAKFPLKMVWSVFKSRGGYQSHLSSSHNPMVAMAENIGLVYTEGMWRLDNIALFTRATAEAVRDLSTFITGKTYKRLEGVSTGIWRLSMIVTKPFMLAFRKIFGLEKGEGIWSTFLGKIPGFRKFRRLGEVYGGIRGVTAAEKGKKEMNFYERMIEYTGAEKKQRVTENKRGKILVEGSKEQTKGISRLRKKLRGGGIFRFLLTAGGLIMSLFKKLLLGGGGFIKTIGSMALGGLKNVLPFLFGGAKAFASFLGPVSAVLGAGAMGYGLGTIIERSIIAPLRKKHFKEMDKLKEKARKSTLESRKQAEELRKKFATKTGRAKMTGEEKRKMTILGKSRLDIAGRGELMKLKERRVGFSGRWHMQAIKDSQEAYLAEHLNEYALYTPEEIRALRGKWIRANAFRPKALGEDPIKYGKEREAAFLAFLKRTGTPVDFEKTPVGKAKEMTGMVMEKSKIVAGSVGTEVMKLQGHVKMFGNTLEKAGEKIMSGDKEIAMSVNNMSNAVVNQMTNTTANTMESTRKTFKKGDRILQHIVDANLR